jgi:hypothetical protein
VERVAKVRRFEHPGGVVRKALVVASLVLLPVLASAQGTPSEGVALKVRRGFFTETDIGGFLTLGGDNDYSNLQSYLQLGIGYDISDVIELGLHVGIGSNAQNCFAGLDDRTGECLITDNFTMTFIDASLAYLIRIGERFYLSPKLLGGYTLLDPAPVVGTDGRPVTSGINLGTGVGVEYATHMDHFSIGLDLIARYIGGPNILSFQFYPRVKYTF